MGDVISFIMDNFPQFIAIATSLVGAFSVIAAMTPNKSDDKFVQLLLDFVNFLACNFGKAANKDGVDKKAEAEVAPKSVE